MSTFKIITSDTDNCPLAPGEYYEEIIDLPPGKYTFTVYPKEDKYKYTEDFRLQIFTAGQRIASDEGNMPGHCGLVFNQNLKLKLKVIRGQSKVQEKLHFKLVVSGYDEAELRRMGEI